MHNGRSFMFRYDDTNNASIIKYAKKLEGKSFSEVVRESNKYLNEDGDSVLHEDKAEYYSDAKSKGSLGHLIEEYYFGYDINSNQEADFNKTGLELKVIPLKEVRNKISVKERVVVTIINYDSIIDESFENSHVVGKLSSILMVFYLHDGSDEKLNYRIKNVYHYTVPYEDYLIIKRDYDLIAEKVRAGKAHELSEGDTLFLGACTKGANKSALRTQPKSDVLAMQRAFSLKISYMNYVYSNYVIRKSSHAEKIIKDSTQLLEKSFEDIVLEMLVDYYGKTKSELLNMLGLSYEKEPKNILTIIIYRILGVKTNLAEEFTKANIDVKTIRLNNKNEINEHMSFPTFKFTQIVNQDWPDSDLYNIFSEKKFLFVVFEIGSDNEYRLKKALFWNMPIDILNGPVQDTWQAAKSVVKNGLVLKKRGSRTTNNFPSASYNRICHVRPHAQNKHDVYPMPDGSFYTKQSFWLDKRYVLKIINGCDK